MDTEDIQSQMANAKLPEEPSADSRPMLGAEAIKLGKGLEESRFRQGALATGALGDMRGRAAAGALAGEAMLGGPAEMGKRKAAPMPERPETPTSTPPMTPMEERRPVEKPSTMEMQQEVQERRIGQDGRPPVQRSVGKKGKKAMGGAAGMAKKAMKWKKWASIALPLGSAGAGGALAWLIS